MKLLILMSCCSIIMMSYGTLFYKNNGEDSDDQKNSKTVVSRSDLTPNNNEHVSSKSFINDKGYDEIKAVVDSIEKKLKQLNKSDLVGNEEWYDELYHWKKQMRSVLEKRSGDDLLKVMEFPMKYIKEYYGRTDVPKPVLTILYYMHHLGPSVSRVLAEKIEEEKGLVDSEIENFALEFFAEDDFHDSNFWPEDELPSLTRSGLFIALFNQEDPIDEVVLEKLGRITTSIDVNKYFKSYMENGSGMRVLKYKFSENREKIEQLYKLVEDHKKKKRESDDK